MDRHAIEQQGQQSWQPLAARMRPRHIDDFLGQQHLLGDGKPLSAAIKQGQLFSMVLWGPPGTGKTTLARLLAANANARLEQISAVLAGVKDIREVVARAKQAKQSNQDTLLFVDEVHRFNKSQQDAFLPHVEDGTLLFIGATTENPSFALNNALLSRARVLVLKRLEIDTLVDILQQGFTDSERGYGGSYIGYDDEQLKAVASMADGDARRALNLLETVIQLALADDSESPHITDSILQQALVAQPRAFDNHGDVFHEQISALHKSVRGSAPDASLYWMMRMLDGGCDPLYIARRLVRMASEDIGNADPRALQLALNAWETQERLGSPEGELALAQAVLYLASAPKSNAVYTAFNQAKADMQQYGSQEVPVHLRNAPTKLMKELGYGKVYRYAHDEPNAYAAGENYFPEGMSKRDYYQPVQRGLEIKIKEKLNTLKQWDEQYG